MLMSAQEAYARCIQNYTSSEEEAIQLGICEAAIKDAVDKGDRYCKVGIDYNISLSCEVEEELKALGYRVSEYKDGTEPTHMTQISWSPLKAI